MEMLHLILLAIVQGITEFLPISSSGHLILLPLFGGWADQGLAYDIAVHLGSLCAVVGYFRRDLARMAHDSLGSLRGQGQTTDSRLAWLVLAATIPVGIAGLLFNDLVETTLRSPLVIAATTVGFGLLLGIADSTGTRRIDITGIRWRMALLIGLAQAIALIPGTSRSGITMTAGLFLGLTREASARFSFLLAIPVIVLASGKQALDLLLGGTAVAWVPLALVTVLSGLSALLCIHFFLKLLERIGMWPFVWYRLALGAVILLFVANGH